jgi:hypothetical protein
MPCMHLERERVCVFVYVEVCVCVFVRAYVKAKLDSLLRGGDKIEVVYREYDWSTNKA